MTSEREVAADLLRRVTSEFLEMPGLCLTEAQARRLWGLEAEACSALLRALVESQFLRQTRDGAFMRIERATPSSSRRAARRTALI